MKAMVIIMFMVIVWIGIMIALEGIHKDGLLNQPAVKTSTSTKKVTEPDMILKGGKFISPRQMSAVTGDEDA